MAGSCDARDITLKVPHLAQIFIPISLHIGNQASKVNSACLNYNMFVKLFLCASHWLWTLCTAVKSWDFRVKECFANVRCLYITKHVYEFC